ncbi:DUF2207 domain-containing protein [Allosaccharopolyspora coralli]|uniref:DUF2207 domain-containing protein n=1 Tax=Allosaccharopolyspora coralli TaxID=2665642 RepID=A0A5Q3Q3A4_9PSEU|nr:DUF2207 domain-containing protein [Allosaccharopolyspora coralli]QGK68932.1 DUF2207 domain-containing protein [Allosaccharopolyspora coralli]
MSNKRVLISAVVGIVATIFLCLPVAASAQELRGAASSQVDVTVERDGALTVTEKITVPPGQTAHRTVPLREPADDGARERVHGVRDISVDGPGTGETDGETFRLSLEPGESTVTYVVDGTVAPLGEVDEVSWQVAGGWDVPLEQVGIDFRVPAPSESIMCTTGSVGAGTPCDEFQITHTQEIRGSESDLAPGDRIDFTVQLPAAAVPANAVFEDTFSLTRAFSLTPASGAGLAGAGLALVGGFGVLWYVRGRDTAALVADVDPVDVLVDGPDGVTFASPDGVLPGQVGTVVDEHVDVVDVTATMLDLAVRNYLWIEEIPGEQGSRDWRIVGLNPPDESLRDYERAVYELLLGTGEGQREVLLSHLRAGEALDLTRVRDALYADVVDHGWFTRRPDTERNLFWWLGVGLGIAGVVLTVLLAATSALALLGVAVALGGVALTFGAGLMPARTSRGSAVVAQVRGLRDYLHSATADALPAGDREVVFSRSLPYAVVLGETARWLAEFAELDPGADGTPGLYWYGEYVTEAGHVVPDLRRFRTHLPLLIDAMDGVLAQAGHLRSLR